MNPLEFPSITGSAVSTPSVQRRLALSPILVADDDADDLFFAARLVKKTGTAHPLITFDDGEGVVDYLSRAWLTQPEERHLLPRLLFLDLKMTGLGGFAFLEWIREHRALAPLNVIVLSGSDEPGDIARAKALGARRYLMKHPSLATFTTIVQGAHSDEILKSEGSRAAADTFYQAGSPEWRDNSVISGLRQRP